MTYELQDKANELDFFHMVASTRISVPMLHMALQDNIDSLASSTNLADGSRIQIVLSARGGKSTTYEFRLNSFKRQPAGGGYRYEIDAYLDAPTYWHTSRTDPFKGTSYEAMAHIASRCNLNFSGSSTSDSQVWMPRNMRYHEWARSIADYGFRSDSGFMKLGLNLDKTLVYKDVIDETPSIKNMVFAEYTPNGIMISDAVPAASSGTLNHYSGYQDSLIEQDVMNASVFKENKNVTVSKGIGQKSLLVNSKIKQAVDQSRILFNPIDPGNTHANYERAGYQNERMNALFSSRIEVVTPQATDLRLLDAVTLVFDKGSEYLQAFSGKYVIASRAVRLEGNEYFEKFELLRRSVNTELRDSL
jgi:hypothetical protein